MIGPPGITLMLSLPLLAAVFVDEGVDPGIDRAVRFNRDVWPILSNHCSQCHGPDSTAL